MTKRTAAREAGASIPLAAVIALFLISGASGLIYEVIWLRSLTLVFGKTVHAASAVLAAFMAGLALGSGVGGRLVDRWRARPLRIYAMLEAGIGVWALLLPLAQMGLQSLYVSLSGPFEHLSFALSVTRFAAATLTLMPATALMGATLPALSRWAVRHDREVGRRLGLLYALNTLGGVIGCLAAGFYLLEAFGLSGTTWIAAGGNFAVAGIAWLLSRRQEAGSLPGADRAAPPAPAPSPAAPGADLVPARLAMVMGAVALGGFGALVLEVVWSRTLLLVFGSTAYSFSAMLSVFLFGIGAGSLLMTPFADRLRRPWIVMGWLQGGIGVLVLGSAHLVDRLPEIYLELMSGWGLTWAHELQAKFLLSAGLMLLPTLLSGAVWPVAVRLARPRRDALGAQVGRLYAANTVGSIAGSLAGAFVFLPALGMQQSLAGVSILMAGFGAAMAMMEPAGSARLAVRAGSCLGIVGLAGALAVTLAPWDHKRLTSGAYFMPRAYLDDQGRPVLRERLKEAKLLFYGEGVTTTPSVAILGDINKAFFNDGKIEGATALDGMRLQRMLGHLPLLLHPGEPSLALNIGLGSGITVGAMGTHPVARIDCAEIEPIVVKAAGLFEKETFSILSRPGLRMIYNDGRNHLMMARQPYDVVSSAPFAPLVGGAASLYSLEHFRLVRQKLAPGGLTAQFLPLYQLSPSDYLSILATFAEVFPEATAWFTGVETVLVGGRDPQSFDFGTLAARMQDPKVAQSLREIGLDDPVRLLSTFCFRVSDLASELKGVPLNTDDRPRIEFSAPRSHLVNTVRENLPWLMARLRSPEPYLRLPQAWPSDDPRRAQVLSRLGVMMRAQRLTMQGRLQILQGDLEGGIATLEQAVAADTADVYARDLAARNLVKLAEERYAAGRPGQAMQAYERALRWDPRHFLALYNLARLVWDAGDAPRARELTEQALAQAPHSPSLNYRMGLVLTQAGDARRAEESLRRALDLDPEFAEPLLALGDLARGRGEKDQAVFLYRQAIDRGRGDAEAYAALAGALTDQGKAEEAWGWVMKAIDQARASLAAGRREQARRELGEALRAGGDRARRLAQDDPSLSQLLGGDDAGAR